MGPELAIDARQLMKTYRGRPTIHALRGLDLQVPTGKIVGLVGPNGAGKTTLLRILTGQLRASSGELLVLGHDIAANPSLVMDRVGAMVERPALFPGFSGRRNLELLARMREFPLRRVAEVLEMVDLREAANRPVRSYSLGMQQRLGIAASLLKRPELLILDEPSNGLDPTGALQLRALLATMRDEGTTILISSHVLPDIERLCEHVAFVMHGRAVRQGRIADVLAEQQPLVRVVVGGADAAQAHALEILRLGGFTVYPHGDRAVDVDVARSSAAAVSEALGRSGIWVEELTTITKSLEDTYIALSGEADRGTE